MKYKDIKDRHDQLERDVMNALKKEIISSNVQHPSYDAPAIEVNVFDYTHMAIIDSRLRFIDSRGLLYSLYAECSLEDLIDILSKL